MLGRAPRMGLLLRRAPRTAETLQQRLSHPDAPTRSRARAHCPAAHVHTVTHIRTKRRCSKPGREGQAEAKFRLVRRCLVKQG